MPHHNTSVQNLPACMPPWGADGERSAKVRDRVLLYARGLEIPPMLSLELALESMRRASLRQPGGVDGIAVATAMEELHGLLREKGISLKLTGADGQRLESAPPICRRHMVSEGLETSFTLRFLSKLRALGWRRAG